MNVINYMLKTLEGSIKGAQFKSSYNQIPERIMMLDGSTPIRPNSFCICSIREIIQACNAQTIPKNTMFFVPVTLDMKNFMKPDVNIVETTLSTAALYNLLNEALVSLQAAAAAVQDEDDDFSAFFSNVMSLDLSGSGQIQSELYSLPFNSMDPYNIIVIETADAENIKGKYKLMRPELLQVFPTSNITIYANRIVVMYHHVGRQVHLPKEQLDAFEEMLETHNAWAGISNHTSNFEMIRTEYIIALSVLDICKRMFPNSDSRIFTQEEHGTFFIMDLCYRQCEKVFHHDNMMYLCHPGIAALIRYDTEHGTNLREILLNYLLNDRSLSKTSQLMFMHRNTTMNKINRINEIVEDDLDDPLIRQRLLFSCLFYDYCEKFKQKPFVPLPKDELK